MEVGCLCLFVLRIAFLFYFLHENVLFLVLVKLFCRVLLTIVTLLCTVFFGLKVAPEV